MSGRTLKAATGVLCGKREAGGSGREEEAGEAREAGAVTPALKTEGGTVSGGKRVASGGDTALPTP